MKKKIISYFLVVAMVFSTMPGMYMTAYGADEESVMPAAAGDVIQTVSPSSTVINVFDYQQFDDQLTGTSYIGTNQDSGYENGREGINKGHGLKFSSSVGDLQNFNSYSGYRGAKDEDVYPDIVQDKLGEDGYPVLTAGLTTGMPNDDESTTTAESLSYLFDSEQDVDGRTAYSNVKGLLQVTEDNYYSYDSDAFFAELNTNTKEFTVKELGSGGNVTNFPGFYPFNTLNTDGTNVNETKNYHFGVSMTTRFLQPEGGERANGEAVTYEFSGDDDVWIFIDGVLVADLGGIHGKASVNINFATGAIKINNQEMTTSLGNLLGYNTDTLPDDSLHTLKFFYLERGTGASNMKLKFNLVTVPESDIAKTDEQGDVLGGASFNLYAADENYTKGDLIATGTTDSSGKLALVDDQDRVVYFQDLFERNQTAYYVLEETKAPDGYRKSPDMHLQYDEDTGAILAANYWDTGAFASGKVNVYIDANAAETDPYAFVSGSTVDGNTSAKEFLGEDGQLSKGMFFAVPLRYTGSGASETDLAEQSNWYGVYTDSDGSYHLTEGNGEKLNGIVEAAQKGGATEFAMNANGQYQAEIEDLPGRLDEYYFMLDQMSSGNTYDTKWTVGFYYTTAESFAQVTADNTARLANSNDFTRQFAANFHISDIKNELYVQKHDEAGNPVEGAEFSLYETETFSEDVTADSLRNTDAYDNVTTETLTFEESGATRKGAAVFPSDIETAPLVNGKYYLVETKAPDGYQLSDSVVEVIVDDTGVYANATAAGLGEDEDSDDGVNVYLGVGHLVHSMSQFAYGTLDSSEKSIDTTLHDIIAILQDLSDDDEWIDSDSEKLHLQYGADGRVMDFGPAAGGETFATISDGWSRLKIQQCLEHKGQEINYTDLDDRDLSAMFSGYTVVEVTDERTADLDLSKAVAGYEGIPAADLETIQKTEFTFEVELTDSAGKELTGTYSILDKSGDELGNVKDGKAKITLSNDEHAVLKGLPLGTKYIVTETGVEGTDTDASALDKYETGITVSNPLAGEDKAEKPGLFSRIISWFTGDDGDAEVQSAADAFNIDEQQRTVSGKIPDAQELEEAGITEKLDLIEIAYTNTYTVEGASFDSLIISGTKTLDGREWTDSDSFTFKMEGSEENDVIEPEVEDVTITKTADSDGDGTAEFTFDLSALTFTVPGTYVYSISEAVPEKALPGVTYSQAEYELRISVKDDGGNLTVDSQELKQLKNDKGETVNAAEAQTVAFTNTFAASDTFGGITVEKTLTGRAMKADEFSFKIEGVGDAADLISDADKTFSNTAAAEGEAAVIKKLETIRFNQGDIGKTYQFRVSEEEGNSPGITYDKSEYLVSVSVLADADSDTGLRIETTVTRTKDRDGSEITDAKPETGSTVSFENSYSASTASDTPLVIAAAKELTGRSLQAGEFTFELRTNPTGTAGTTVSTAANTADGKIVFDGLSYTLEDLKQAVKDGYGKQNGNTYELSYIAVEKTEGLAEKGITQAAGSFNFTVTVTDDGSGHLTAQAVYPTGGLVFKNTYATLESDISMEITGQKLLAGTSQDITGKYTFTIEAEEGAPLPKETTAQNQSSGAVDFGTVTFSADLLKDIAADENGVREKTFVYRVTESGAVSGITNDPESTKTFKITLRDDGKGHLTASANPADGPLFTFTNTGTTPPSTPKISVTVNKVWITDDGGKAADSVTVQLMRNGVAYGSAVKLTAANGWSYTFSGLSKGYNWTVEEIDVPEGFAATVAKDSKANGNLTFTITNDDVKDEINNPTNPAEPTEPTEPTNPTDPNKPDKPQISEGNGDVDLPKTGDDTLLSKWILLLMTAAGAMTTLTIYRRKKKAE